MGQTVRPVVKTDCRHFRGDIPCVPHKRHGVHCVDAEGKDCTSYDPVSFTVLIIKLGAIGDVIRTTPLITRIHETYRGAHITWLTQTPEILPSVVDTPMPYTMQSVVTLRSQYFDLLINLDKDRDACALADQIGAVQKKGFILRDGIPAPVNKDAEHKYFTGIFDDLSKANTKSYMREMFEICGFEFKGERYILDRVEYADPSWKLSGKRPVVGLNTGCGGRWTSRLWDDKNWTALAKELKGSGYDVVLLGGEQEHTRNTMMAKKAGVHYFGHYPLAQFVALLDRCDLVVTGVTMAMHLTLGLGKKIVLFNNIFNKHEFDLYESGEVIEPGKPCRCFYSPTCVNSEYRCMEYLSVSTVLQACSRLLPVAPVRRKAQRHA